VYISREMTEPNLKFVQSYFWVLLYAYIFVWNLWPWPLIFWPENWSISYTWHSKPRRFWAFNDFSFWSWDIHGTDGQICKREREA